MKTATTCLATCLMAAPFMGSCRKSDLPEPSSGYSRVRHAELLLEHNGVHVVQVQTAHGTFTRKVVIPG